MNQEGEASRAGTVTRQSHVDGRSAIYEASSAHSDRQDWEDLLRDLEQYVHPQHGLSSAGRQVSFVSI